jgi:hypothetical protein
MGIFRSSKSGVADLERDVDGLKTRRKTLLAQQQTAAAALAQAREDRRTRLLEHDLDSANGDRERVKGLVIRLTDEHDAIADALATVESRLTETEARLTQGREARACELEGARRREQIARARAAVQKAAAANREVIAAFEPLGSIVISAKAAAENTRHVGDQLGLGYDLALREIEAYCTRLLAGTEVIKAEPVPVPVVSPPPKVARRSIVVLQPSKWIEADGAIRTAGRLSEADPPIAIAERALELRNAILFGSG